MKRVLPFLLFGTGVLFLLFAHYLHGGPSPTQAVNNVVSLVMTVSGALCIICGVVTFFLRDDPDIW